MGKLLMSTALALAFISAAHAELPACDENKDIDENYKIMGFYASQATAAQMQQLPANVRAGVLELFLLCVRVIGHQGDPRFSKVEQTQFVAKMLNAAGVLIAEFEKDFPDYQLTPP